MLGTYASFLVILAACVLVGQAILVACGRPGWSWLAPATGLAALCALAWWTVRLPGEGTAALITIAIAAAASALYLRGRVATRSVRTRSWSRSRRSGQRPSRHSTA